MPEPTTVEETPLTMEGLKDLLASERQASIDATTALVESRLDELSTPDRSTVESLGIGNTPHPMGDTSTIIVGRTTSDIARGTAVSVVSRHQPLDTYYRKLSPEMQEWRTADSDHWGAEWIRAQYLKDFGRMQQAYDKSEEWVERSYGRADTLEGAGSATGAVGGGVGGEFIPRPVEQAILIARNNVAKMRRFASSLVMTRQVHQIPTATSMTGEMSAEASTADQQEPTIGQVALIAQKGQVKAIASLEMLDDEAVNLVGLYSQLAGEALGTLEDDQFWSTGNGTPPNISSKVDGTAYAEETSGVLAFIDVVQMYSTPKQIYRDRGSWYVATDVLKFLTMVVDANSARQFYPGLSEAIGFIGDDQGAVGSLMRRPVYEVAVAPGIIIFGDMNAGYIVGDRQGITATSSAEVLFETQRVMWLWTQRFDGNDRDAAALVRAAGITSATNSVVPA